MAPELRVSTFNHIVVRPDCVIGLNLTRGVFAVLDPESLAVLEGRQPLCGLNEEKAKILESQGFLVRGDEKARLHQRVMEAQTPSRYSHLVLTPTIACNFRCEYCFQNDMRSPEIMSEAVSKRLLEIIESLVSQGKGPQKITWFGGEPLLAIDFIVDFVEKLRAIYKGEILPEQDMITNGVLLDKECLHKVQRAGISKIQVSFDCLSFKKPNGRGVLDERGLASVICENALRAISAGLQVHARVNVSSKNVDAIEQITDGLKRVGLGRSVYYARVEGDFAPVKKSKVKIPITVESAVLSIDRRRYAELEKQRLFNRENFHHLVRKLRPRMHFCGATDGSMIVVAPDGGISRCWNSAGRPEEEIGHILRNDVGFLNGASGDTDSAWDSYSAFSYESCRNCKVLPICMGGCAHPRAMQGSSESPCTPVKYYIDELVEYVGKHLSIEGAVAK